MTTQLQIRARMLYEANDKIEAAGGTTAYVLRYVNLRNEQRDVYCTSRKSALHELDKMIRDQVGTDIQVIRADHANG